MLDNLVESKNHSQENKKLNGLLSGIFALAALGMVFAFVLSLYSFELSLGNGDLEISTLTAPVMIDEPKPEEPQIIKKEVTQTKAVTNVPTRVENIQRVNESPVKPPEKVSTTPSKVQSRPNAPFKIGTRDFNPDTPSVASTNGRETGNGGGGSGISNNTQSVVIDDEKEKPEIKKPVVKETVKEPTPKKNVVVSGGVVNGKAKTLVQPVYSAAARAVRAAGKVEVQVTIDETGRVIDANVLSGHTLLRESALSAARKSTFSPTFLTNQPVKVSGVIVYNFNP